MASRLTPCAWLFHYGTSAIVRTWMHSNRHRHLISGSGYWSRTFRSRKTVPLLPPQLFIVRLEHSLDNEVDRRSGLDVVQGFLSPKVPPLFPPALWRVQA